MISTFIIDETAVIQIGCIQHFWLWFVLDQYIVVCLEYTFQKKDICLYHRILVNNDKEYLDWFWKVYEKV